MANQNHKTQWKITFLLAKFCLKWQFSDHEHNTFIYPPSLLFKYAMLMSSILFCTSMLKMKFSKFYLLKHDDIIIKINIFWRKKNYNNCIIYTCRLVDRTIQSSKFTYKCQTRTVTFSSVCLHLPKVQNFPKIL